MLRSSRISTRTPSALLAAVCLLALAGTAHAGISNVQIVKNAGNSGDGTGNGDTDRRSEVAVQSSTASGFTTRYSWAIVADQGLTGTDTVDLTTDYSITFDVVAAGDYTIDVAGLLKAAPTLVDDGGGRARVRFKNFTASSSHALSSGSLGASFEVDSGMDANGFYNDFSESAAAVIQGTSNGATISHTLTFGFFSRCDSTYYFGSVAGGDECAVRGGIDLGFGSETASDYPGTGSRSAAADGHFITVALTEHPACGDGAVDAGEDCDGGICCTASCTFVGAGTECRGSADLCDVAETCTGASASCPADGFAVAGTGCRASSGLCDPAETCTGLEAGCPADVIEPAGTLCRAQGDVCDAEEVCDGVAKTCPADTVLPAGVECRADSGICDVADQCDGTNAACPADVVAPAGAECRASAGVCDEAEQCDGVSGDCPADGFVDSGTVCRAASGACDVAETCSGSAAACPANGFASSSTLCRAAVGACDAAENCSGSSAACPADGFAAPGTVCRPVASVCDQEETCTGSGTECPADQVAAAGVVCRAANGACDSEDVCDGVSGACPADTFLAAGTVCRASSGDACDEAEVCSGTDGACPADAGLPDTDEDGACDAIDNCPDEANAGQEDDDADGQGNLCDACTNSAGTVVAKPILKLVKLDRPAGDQKAIFKGIVSALPSAPAVDPISNGLRFLLEDGDGSLVLDETLPAGAWDPVARIGWRPNGKGSVWTFLDKRKEGAGPVVLAKLITLKAAGQYKVIVKLKDADIVLTPEDAPLVATVVIDAPLATDGQCAEVLFAAEDCALNGKGSAMKCR